MEINKENLDNECEWYCDKNCNEIELYKDYWKPFKSLCYLNNHSKKIYQEDFKECYICEKNDKKIRLYNNNENRI